MEIFNLENIRYFPVNLPHSLSRGFCFQSLYRE